MDRDLLRKALRLQICRQCFGAFVQHVQPGYLMGWVHERICAELDRFLQAVVDGKSPRLMLTLPPRHGKSTLASRCFPAYVLGRYPDMSIIAASYSADLASRMNRDVQHIMEDEPYAELFPSTKLAKLGDRGAVRTSDMFDVVGHNGVYRSAGVGGGITGLGCHIAVLDDVIKDRASADSPTVLQSVFDWYTSTLYTRLAPGGGIIIMNTRWSTQDLSGRLLEAQAKGEGDTWRVVNFPAVAEVDELPYRKAGEALHPERYPLDQLQQIKKAIGTRDWESLYQQHPIPDGGVIFKKEWLQRTWLPKDLPLRFNEFVIAFDMAFKGLDTSDFVVGILVGKQGPDYYLLDLERGRWSFTESIEAVRRLVARAKKWTPRPIRILIEDKANGPAVIDSLKREISGIVPVQPNGSKEARAHACTVLFESHCVVIPESSIAPWVDEFKSELLSFPSGAHDDQVDACVYALKYLSEGHSLSISSELRTSLNLLHARRRVIP